MKKIAFMALLGTVPAALLGAEPIVVNRNASPFDCCSVTIYVSDNSDLV